MNCGNEAAVYRGHNGTTYWIVGFSRIVMHFSVRFLNLSLKRLSIQNENIMCRYHEMIITRQMSLVFSNNFIKRGVVDRKSFCIGTDRGNWSSLMVQWVKKLALSLLWLRSLLWHGFDSWPRNFRMP